MEHEARNVGIRGELSHADARNASAATKRSIAAELTSGIADVERRARIAGSVRWGRG